MHREVTTELPVTSPAPPVGSLRVTGRVRRLVSLAAGHPYAAYVGAVSLVVGCYLLVWLTHFHSVYGWIMDDVVSSYTKGMLTVHDWRGAFLYYNALQPYFFLISYLPLKLAVSLPSYPIPTLGDETGHFRFLLLYTLFLHAFIVFLWGLFARVIAPASVALLSVVLFATSPTLTLWTPQPESRLLGMPFILVGLILLLRLADPVRRASIKHAALLFGVGSLFGVGQSIHYTSLYLIVPFCLAFWGVWLRSGWRTAGYWVGLVSFSAGCIWLPGLLEGVSYFMVQIPISKGPLATLLELRDLHSSRFSTLGNLELWRDWFISQMGVPLVAAALVGLGMYARAAWQAGTHNRAALLAFALTLPIALAYFIASGTIAFFRQTSTLQPLIFLMAGFCVVTLAQRLARYRWQSTALAAGLVGMIGLIPWTQAYAVFEAHQGLGRALEWAAEHRGDRQLVWFPIAWFDDQISVTSPEELQQLPADTWLISYYPFSTIRDHPSLQAYLDSTVPVAEWPSLYSTDAMAAELNGTSDDDVRSNPLLSKVRIVRVGDIVANMQGVPLVVSQVSADSASGASEPVNVFDGDSSPDNNTEWVSGDSAEPHWLQIDLAQPTVLRAVNIVLPTPDRSPYRVAAMEIEVQDETGTFRTVWTGHNLANSPLVHASWASASIRAVRINVQAELKPWSTTTAVAIEEVVFPGYRVIAPLPERSFAPLELTDVQLSARGLEVDGTNITPSTSLLIGAVVFPTIAVSNGTHLVARVPSDVQGHEILSSAALVDRFRTSNAVQVELRPPVLERVDPAVAQVDAANVTLTATTDDAAPGTAIVFDAHPLNTFFGNAHWLTAALPRELINRTGRHTVSVRNALGESIAQDFTVGLPEPGPDQAQADTSTEPLVVAPAIVEMSDSSDPVVIRDVSPANVRVGEGPRQPDGTFALSLDVEGAALGTVVVLDGQPLRTFYGGGTYVTAVLPSDFYDRAATHQVYATRGGVRSAPRDLAVTP